MRLSEYLLGLPVDARYRAAIEECAQRAIELEQELDELRLEQAVKGD